MPDWLNTALWIIWSLWFVLELLITTVITVNRNNMSRTTYGSVRLLMFIACTVLWFCYKFI